MILIKNYDLTEEWQEIVLDEVVTLCPIIKKDTKLVICYGEIGNVDTLKGIRIVYNHDKDEMAYDEEHNPTTTNIYYVTPFKKVPFKINSNEKMYARVLSGTGILVVANAIIEGCR